MNVFTHASVSLFVFIQDYLQNFWPELQAAHELYDSISQALQEKEGEGKEREYSEHLPAEVLEAGIKSGRYFQVHCAPHTQCDIRCTLLGQSCWYQVGPFPLTSFFGSFSDVIASRSAAWR